MIEKTHSPKSVLQLVSCSNGSTKPKAGKALGTIVVCDVDATGAEAIRVWTKANPSYRVGAMGTRRVVAERESISLDFTYGVIDKGILRALVGESSLLLTRRQMVPRVAKRVETYCKESGNTIAVIPLNTTSQSSAAGGVNRGGPSE